MCPGVSTCFSTTYGDTSVCSHHNIQFHSSDGPPTAHVKVLKISVLCSVFVCAFYSSTSVYAASMPRRGRRDRSLYADCPPLPPPSVEMGRKLPDHERQRRPKPILLELLEGEKWGFTPCVYTQNTQSFEENPIMDENQIEPNMNTNPMQNCVRDGPYPSG